MHADSSLNVIASYTDIATRGKSVNRGGLAGLLGGKKYKEEKYEVTKELNLSLNFSFFSNFVFLLLLSLYKRS